MAGIGRHWPHFSAPEMSDVAVTPGEHVERWHVRIIRADIVTRVIAGEIGAEGHLLKLRHCEEPQAT